MNKFSICSLLALALLLGSCSGSSSSGPIEDDIDAVAIIETQDKEIVYRAVMLKADGDTFTNAPLISAARVALNGMYPIEEPITSSKSVFYLVDMSKDGVVEKDGSPLKFNELGFYSDGVIPARIDDDYIVIDKKGNTKFCINEKIGKEIDRCGSYFRCGLLKVKSEGKWGFINTSGKVVIPFIYDDILTPSFINGYAIAKKTIEEKEAFVVIDTKGNEVSPAICDFEEITAFDGKYIAVKYAENKFAILDRDGELKLKVPGEIGDITQIADNTIVCRMPDDKGVFKQQHYLVKGHYTVMDFTGKILFSPEPNTYIKMVDKNKFLSLWCGHVTTIGRDGAPLDGSGWNDGSKGDSFIYFPNFGVIAGDYDNPEYITGDANTALIRKTFCLRDCGLYTVDGKQKSELTFRAVGLEPGANCYKETVPDLLSNRILPNLRY